MSDLNNGMRMPMLPNGMPIPPLMNPSKINYYVV